MNIEQIIFAREAETIEHTENHYAPPYEISVLAGCNSFVPDTLVIDENGTTALCKDTRSFTSKITQTSIDRLHRIFTQYGFLSPTWKRFHDSIKDYGFEPVLVDIPEPEEGEGAMFPLVLESGEAVYLVIRQIKMEVDVQHLISAH